MSPPSNRCAVLRLHVLNHTLVARLSAAIGELSHRFVRLVRCPLLKELVAFGSISKQEHLFRRTLETCGFEGREGGAIVFGAEARERGRLSPSATLRLDGLSTSRWVKGPAMPYCVYDGLKRTSALNGVGGYDLAT